MVTAVYLSTLLLIAQYNPQSLFAGGGTNVFASTKTTTTEMPTVNVCALLKKPEDYDGKEIRVRAIYHVGFEYAYLDDPSCKEYAIETTPYWVGNVVWAAFDFPSIETSTEPSVYKEFKEQATVCCSPDWRDTEAELIVVGRFFKAHNEVGYGHLNMHALQLVVNKIEKVSKTTTANPSPKGNGDNEPK